MTTQVIKLIASDMDDTLLNSRVEISPRNAAAIKAAIASGKIFIIATGRMYPSAQPYAAELGLDVPLVTFNGALVKGSKSGQVFYEHKMTLSTAQAVMDHCRTHNYYVQVYIGEQILIKEETSFSKMYSCISRMPMTVVGEDLYTLKEAPYKLLVMSEPGKFEPMWQEFAQEFAGRLDVTSSKENFLELMEPGVNKWSAVKAVAESYGIRPEEIMCIGDSNNDISMLANAGLGVAVANAKDNVKDHAKLITASNDNDGVALAIEMVLTPQAIE